MQRGPMALFGAIVAVGLGPALWLGAELAVVRPLPAAPATVDHGRVDVPADTAPGLSPADPSLVDPDKVRGPRYLPAGPQGRRPAGGGAGAPSGPELSGSPSAGPRPSSPAVTPGPTAPPVEPSGPVATTPPPGPTGSASPSDPVESTPPTEVPLVTGPVPVPA